MKKIFFILAILLGMTACEDSDYGYFGGLPDYSYFRTDCDARSLKVDTSTPTKINFSYYSWVEAATVCSRMEVPLKASLESIEKEIKVSDYELGEGVGFVLREGNQIRRHHDFSIFDSTLVYRVVYNNFTLDYKMTFSSATYNDNRTAGHVAYYGFENIVDKGCTLTPLEPEENSGFVYMRKLFRHSIRVDFAGQPYEATATVILKKNIGSAGTTYLVGSQLLKQGISDFLSNGTLANYKSWIVVRQIFSNGRTHDIRYEENVTAEIKKQSIDNKNFKDENLKKLESGFDVSKEVTSVLTKNEYVKVFGLERYYIVKYNYCQTTTLFYDTKVEYDDGYNVFEFPVILHNNVQDTAVLKCVSDKEDTYGKYREYLFTENVSSTFGAVKHSASQSYNFIKGYK